MRKLLLISAVVALGACSAEVDPADKSGTVDRSERFNTVCIDGIQYHERARARQGYLAVKIDSETLEPVRCGDAATPQPAPIERTD